METIHRELNKQLQSIQQRIDLKEYRIASDILAAVLIKKSIQIRPEEIFENVFWNFPPDDLWIESTSLYASL